MAKATKPKSKAKTQTKAAPAKKASAKSASGPAKKASAKPAPKTKTAAKPAAKAAPKAAAKKAAPQKGAPQKAGGKKAGAKKSAAPQEKTGLASSAMNTVKKLAKAATQMASNVLSIDNAREKANAKKTGKSLEVAKIFTPLDDRVLVVKTGIADRTPGGLFIPDSVAAGDKPNQGHVVAVGRGHRDKKGRLRPLDVQLGDKILFNSFAGSEITLADETLLVLREEEILAIVKN